MRRLPLTLLLAAAGLVACGEERAAPDATPIAAVTTYPAPTTTPRPPTTPGSEGTSPTTTVAPTTTEPVLTPAAAEIAYSVYAQGVEHPLDMAWRPGDPVPYLVLREGLVVRVRDGRAGETALDLRSAISLRDVQGLLGLTFHPTEPLAYADFNNRVGEVVVAEYRVRDDGTLDPASERRLLSIPQEFPNHNGGQVAFGPDGYLYISVGDGSSGNDGLRNALNLQDLHGKILRIDPTPSGAAQYTIPPDNPFVAVPGAHPEVWAYGLRNPWRFSFDSATGDLWIGDVGQGRIEEVDLARAADGGGRGLNFGWSAFEGTRRFNADQSPDGVTPPVYEYDHSNGSCAVTGGVVYRGSAIRTLRGWYVFADYCSGVLWAMYVAPGAGAQVVQLGDRGTVSAVVAGPDGEVYVLDYGNGKIYLLAPA
jgi:glucose/arabinose dehydrogenase